jgi:hypothetical protein
MMYDMGRSEYYFPSNIGPTALDFLRGRTTKFSAVSHNRRLLCGRRNAGMFGNEYVSGAQQWFVAAVAVVGRDGTPMYTDTFTHPTGAAALRRPPASNHELPSESPLAQRRPAPAATPQPRQPAPGADSDTSSSDDDDDADGSAAAGARSSKGPQPSTPPNAAASPADATPNRSAVAAASAHHSLAAQPLAVSDDSLNLHFLLYASLDVCEERVLQLAAAADSAASHRLSAAAAAEQHHLDHLLQMSGYRTYGYVSSSKIVVMIATSGEPPRDKIRGLLADTYGRVSVALCSPFRAPGEDLSHHRGFVAGVTNTIRPFMPR